MPNHFLSQSVRDNFKQKNSTILLIDTWWKKKKKIELRFMWKNLIPLTRALYEILE